MLTSTDHVNSLAPISLFTLTPLHRIDCWSIICDMLTYIALKLRDTYTGFSNEVQCLSDYLC